MPHLVKWHEELSDFGLIIVAPHVQKATRDEVKAKAEALGIHFAVTASGNVTGSKGEGIPHCVLFDHTGKAIYEGGVRQVENKLRPAVGGGLVAAAGLKDVNKQLVPIVDGLKKGQPPLPALQKLLPISKSTGEAAEQAKALVDKMLEGGQRRLDEAKAQVSDDPVAAYDAVLRLSVSFKNTPIANKAAEQVTKLKNDKAVMAELKARPALETIKKLDKALHDNSKGVDPKSAEFKKAFAAQLKQMKSTLATMERSWPNARATKQALEITEKYELARK